MLAVTDQTDYEQAIPDLLDHLQIHWEAWNNRKVAIKPNLVSYEPYPFTTDVNLVRVLLQELKKRCPKADAFVIEGAPFGTTSMYARHGYNSLPCQLIDVDTCGVYYLSQICNETLPEVPLPLALKDAILISCAVLKEHQDCTVTGTVKNLVGMVPAADFSENGLWRDKLHQLGIDNVIKALNCHKKVDLAILDGRIGGRGDNMTGDLCNPPIGKILAGEDAYEVDCAGAALLGHDPSQVVHLRKDSKAWIEL